MAKIAVLPSLALGAYLTFGFGSCVPHIPVTVNAESAASEAPSTEPADPAVAGRMTDCAPGTADCDRDRANGCEAVLADDPKNCGVCGQDCAAPNIESGCMGGTCRVIGCSPGFCDYDHDPENGCETPDRKCDPARYHFD